MIKTKIIIKYLISSLAFLTIASTLYADNYPNTSIGVLDLNRVLLDIWSSLSRPL